MSGRALLLPCFLVLAAFALSANLVASAGEQKLNETSSESPRTQLWVRIGTPAGRSLRSFVTYPQLARATHAVILLHDNRGLSAWEQGLADQLAVAGYVAIVPDLLSEMGPSRGDSDSFESAGAAREALQNLSAQQVADELDAVLHFANGLESTDKRIAVAGFGWGGGQAFRYAAHSPLIATAIVFSGPAPNDEQLQQIRVPVYGFYGETDTRVASDVPKLKARMKALGKTFQPEVYPRASHDFLRTGEAADANPADRKACDAAWARLKEVLSTL